MRKSRKHKLFLLNSLMVIPHRPPFSGPGGMTPGRSEEEPGEFFRDFGGPDRAPNVMEDEERRMRQRPKPILSIFNILLAVLCIFILSISILVVTTITSTVDTSTGMRTFDETYTLASLGGANETKNITNPYLDQTEALSAVPGAQPSVYQYNGTTWLLVPAGSVTWNALIPQTIAVDKGALQT